MNPAAKREAIMASGEALFSQKGYTNTSIADIAKEADVAVGSVYRLFPDKPSLLAALHQNMEQGFINAMTRGWKSTDVYQDRFDPMIDSLFNEAERVMPKMPLYAMTKDMIGTNNYVPGDRMIETIERMYAQGVKAGVYRAIPKGIVGSVAHAMVDGAMRAWMSDPTPARRKKIQRELLSIFERSFLQ